MKSEIHYIVGLGRSGSTLLTTMLNSHSRIKGVPEIPMIIFFLYLYNKQKNINDSFVDYVKTYLEEYQTIRPKDIVNLNIDEIAINTSTQNYYAFCKDIFELFEINGKQGKKEIYIDKNPPYTFHYDRLTSLSKNSKFIILVRDYRANILSRKQKQYTKSGNIAYNAFRWKFFHKEINKFKHNKNCLLVRYEDLVSNQETVIRKIVTFLDLPFEKELLDYQKIDFNTVAIGKEKTNSFAKDHFSGLNKNINTSRIFAWRDQLSIKEIKTAEQICGNIGKDFNYQKEIFVRNISLVYLLNLPQYIKALIGHYKEKATYYLPINFKMERLKKSMEKLR